jgi:hypothetical protein
MSGEMKTSVGEGRLKVDMAIDEILKAYPALDGMAVIGGHRDDLFEFARTCWNQAEQDLLEAMKRRTEDRVRQRQIYDNARSGMKKRVV